MHVNCFDVCPVKVPAALEAGSLCPFCSKVTHCTLVQEQRSDCGFESVRFLRLSFVQLVGEYRTAYELNLKFSLGYLCLFDSKVLKWLFYM